MSGYLPGAVGVEASGTPTGPNASLKPIVAACDVAAPSSKVAQMASAHVRRHFFAMA